MAYGSALSAAEDAPGTRKARGRLLHAARVSALRGSMGDSLSGTITCSSPLAGKPSFLSPPLIACGRWAANLPWPSVTSSAAKCTRPVPRRPSGDWELGCFRRIFVPVICFLAACCRPSFDVVIGNRPHVRFHVAVVRSERSIGAIAERHGVAVSSLSSLWMPFVLHSVSFLKPGGRLGLVLPAELLTVNYAAPLRSFLMASFSSVRLATFDEPVFPEVQEEVVLLLADGWRAGSCSSITWQQCDDIADLASGKLALYQPPSEGARWSGLFASSDSLSSLGRLTGAGRIRLFVPMGHSVAGSRDGQQQLLRSESERIRAMGVRL